MKSVTRLNTATVFFIAVLIVIASLLVPRQLKAQNATDANGEMHYRAVNLGNLSGTIGSGNTINNIGWSMGCLLYTS